MIYASVADDAKRKRFLQKANDEKSRHSVLFRTFALIMTIQLQSLLTISFLFLLLQLPALIASQPTPSVCDYSTGHGYSILFFLCDVDESIVSRFLFFAVDDACT